MEALQSWALCIVFSAVGALLVHALTPKGATEKAMRVMLALFMLSAILSPFLSGKGVTLTLPSQDGATAQEQMDAVLEKVNRSLAEQARAGLEEKAQRALEEMDVTGAEIQVDMDITDDSIISITELKILLPRIQGGKEHMIRDKLEQTLGCPITVVTDDF